MCLLRGRQANVLHNAALLAQLDSPGKKPIAKKFQKRLVVMRIWKKQDHGIYFLYVSLSTRLKHGSSEQPFMDSRFDLDLILSASSSHPDSTSHQSPRWVNLQHKGCPNPDVDANIQHHLMTYINLFKDQKFFKKVILSYSLPRPSKVPDRKQ